MSTVIENKLASPAVAVRKKSPFKLKFDRSHVTAYLILLMFTAVYLGPLAMLVNTAFKTQASFMRNAVSLPTTLNVANFTEAWQKANFPKYMGNSLLYTTIATAIFVVMAVFVAFPIARNYVKGSGFIFTLFLIALFLPPALVPQFQLMLRLGLYNTQYGYIMLFIVNPVGIIILVNYIRSIPTELDEAAAMDGCGYFRFIVSIIFPLIRPAVATITVLHAIGIWNDLITATIYLTNQNYYPITRGLIVFQGVYGNNWPVLAAAVVIMTIPMVILFLFLQRYIISGLTQGASTG
ncbi:MAG: carbohydrate ABC transporter permease [Anaerolineae bacterium]|nr:carbohydrate ABC transporter permease [Anaerolineae bacterium]